MTIAQFQIASPARPHSLPTSAFILFRTTLGDKTTYSSTWKVSKLAVKSGLDSQEIYVLCSLGEIVSNPEVVP